MRDHWLFAVVPYLAVAVAVTAMSARLAAAHATDDRRAPAAPRRAGLGTIAWRASLGLIALAHAAALAFPDAVLFWTRQEIRLVALEIEGFLAGAIALAGVVAMLTRAIRRHDGNKTPVLDVVALTLVAVSMTSGLLMAIVYRWASSWAEVTLVPYLYSVARLAPATVLVTHLPALVKLHVGAAFVLIAIAPLTSWGGSVAAGVVRGLRASLGPASRLGPARGRAERWTAARVRSASAAMFDAGEEEN